MLYDYTGDWISGCHVTCVNDVVCRPRARLG